MKAYLNYFKLRIITNLQYRSAAIAGILTQFFFGFVFIMSYLAFYESNTSASLPMNISELVTYLWLQQAFFAMIFPFVKDFDLINMITNGNLAYELVRPQSFYFKFYIKMLAERFTSTLLRFFPIIIVGLFLPYPYKLSLPYSLDNFIIFLFALIFACLLVTALSMIVHLIVMFTFDSRGVFTIYTTIADVFMGTIIPIPFFPEWLRKIAYVLPFRYIGDFPYRVYSGNIGVSEGMHLMLHSFIFTIVFIILGYILSKVVLKKAVVQGG